MVIEKQKISKLSRYFLGHNLFLKNIIKGRGVIEDITVEECRTQMYDE